MLLSLGSADMVRALFIFNTYHILEIIEQITSLEI